MTYDDLTVLAHELRAPVAALERLADAAPTARSRGSLGPLLALAVAAGRDLERILREPVATGARETVPIGPLAASAAVAGGDRIELRIAVDPLVRVDPTRVRQALANLVANALRHGERVSIAVDATEEWVRVDVSDDGPGVAAGLDPFQRGSTDAGSTGLGLWLARAIAVEHGGSLELLDGDPGSGARFRLALPRASDVG